MAGKQAKSDREPTLRAERLGFRLDQETKELIERLAVAAAHQGQGLVVLLLADAVQRAYASAGSVGSSMLVVDAISEQAAVFCTANGFVRLPDSLRLVLPMQTIGKLIAL